MTKVAKGSVKSYANKSAKDSQEGSEAVLQNWVEFDPSAYSAVHNGAVLLCCGRPSLLDPPCWLTRLATSQLATKPCSA